MFDVNAAPRRRVNMIGRAGGKWRALTRHEKVATGFGAALVVVATAAFVWTLVATTPERKLPGYALQSALVFEVERALAITAAFGLVGAFCARLIAGDLPSGITTKGVEWTGEADIATALKKTQTSVDDLASAVEANAKAIDVLGHELDTVDTRRSELASALTRAQEPIQEIQQASIAHAKGLRIVAEELESLSGVPTRVVQLEGRTQQLDDAVEDLSGHLTRLAEETIVSLRNQITELGKADGLSAQDQ